MNRSELTKKAYAAIADLRYQAEYGPDPQHLHAEEQANLILALITTIERDEDKDAPTNSERLDSWLMRAEDFGLEVLKLTLDRIDEVLAPYRERANRNE